MKGCPAILSAGPGPLTWTAARGASVSDDAAQRACPGRARLVRRRPHAGGVQDVPLPGEKCHRRPRRLVRRDDGVDVGLLGA